MTRFILPDGKVVTAEQQFRLQDQQYTAKFLSLEERTKLGLVEVIEGPRPNDKFYRVRETSPGTYVGDPKDLVSLKKTIRAELKAVASSLISPHDWRVVREASGGTKAPEEVLAFMAAVRTRSNDLEALLDACVDVASIEQAFTATGSLDWPTLKE